MMRKLLMRSLAAIGALTVLGVGLLGLIVLNGGGPGDHGDAPAEASKPDPRTLDEDELEGIYGVAEEDACAEGFCVTSWKGEDTCRAGSDCRFEFAGTKPAELEGPILGSSSPYYFEKGNWTVTGGEIGSTEWAATGTYDCISVIADYSPITLTIGASGTKGNDIALPWLVTCEPSA